MEFVDGATINKTVDNMNLKKCLFCLTELNDGVEIFGQVGRAVNAQQIILKYFWSELIDETDPMCQYACFDCWLKIKSFHEFYIKVQEIHKPFYCINETNESQVDLEDVQIASAQKEPTLSQHSVIPTEMLSELDSENEIERLFESVTDNYACDMYNFEVDFDENLLEMNNETTSFDAIENVETEATSVDGVNDTPVVGVNDEREEIIGLQIDFLNYDDDLSNTNEATDVMYFENYEIMQTVNGVSYESYEEIYEELTEEENLFTECTIESPPQRKKRGRPRKIDKMFNILEAKRKRGRPPKNVSQIYENIEIDPNLKPHISKGRPRKPDVQFDRIECFICHKRAQSFPELRAHYQLHDPEESSILCFICGRIFTDKNTLSIHLKIVHQYHKTNEYDACPICDKQMKYKCLKTHIKEVHEKMRRQNREFECNVCGRICVTLNSLIQHASTHISDKLTRVQCEICEKWMKNEHTLQVHRKSHDENQVKCPHCDKVKPNMLKLRSHIALTHSIRKHTCQICQKSFSRPVLLKEHLALHTGEMLYNCAYCPKKFNSNANMYKHLRETHAEQWNIDRAAKKNLTIL